ncbi:hypothetical protein SAY87_007529 [Trapa incisa]|uniref:NAD(P)H-quinone oxidoreductase subunit M, chloroplastic n=1 Tax=Trapa incisa TaxID=236973 RepID=A0AAN7QF34_9MYRT|nr:hypothetical protein SAY87_007529 [Trapa incisa]
MATASSCMASTKFSIPSWIRGSRISTKQGRINSFPSVPFSVSAQQQQQPPSQVEEPRQFNPPPPLEVGGGSTQQPQKKELRPVESQVNVRSRNMSREYGGQWLSSATRHVRIYAAYIDPVTSEFDQTQTDKLTIILDPTNEFLWTPDTCNKVYAYFQELVDHYEGAPLTEYTLRLIGSDVEHYIRKLLYDGEIKYNMNARVLNFSMGKPRILFNNNNNNISEEDQIQ